MRNTRMLANPGLRHEILTHDTALEPEQVAEGLWNAMRAGEFLVLPYPQARDDTAGGVRTLQRRVDQA